MAKTGTSREFSLPLPLTVALPDGGSVVIDHMTDSHMTEMYKMVADAAQRGEGYGVDEYLSESGFRSEVGPGQKLSIMKSDTGELIAGVGNSVGHTCRTQVVVEAFLVIKPSERGRKLGYLCVYLSILLARDYGYVGLLLNMQGNNKRMQRISDLYGFLKVGELPIGCILPDGSYGKGVLYFMNVKETEQVKRIVQNDGQFVFAHK